MRVKRLAKIGLVVLSYWVVSISMVFANKYLVGSSEMNQDMTLFVAWIQCIVCVTFIICYTTIGGMVGFKVRCPQFNISSITDKSRIQLSIVFVLMLSFNNLCLRYVGVAFFQLARSLTLLFTVMFSALILHTYASRRSMLCCMVVVIGFFLGVDQEKIAGTLSIKGVLFGVVTSIFVSLTGILTKKNLEEVDKDPLKLTFYNNFNGIILLFPVVLITDQFSAVLQLDKMYDIYFWVTLLSSGIMAFSMSYISTLQIHFTSPMTHHISNNAKSVLQTILAVSVFHEYKSVLWWVSNGVVITGAFGYAIVKINEEQNKQAMKLRQPKEEEYTRNNETKADQMI